MQTPEEKKEVVVLKALASGITLGLKSIKNDRSNKGRAALGVAKSLLLVKMLKRVEARRHFQSS